ncbi:MoxR family ATPase [Motiliproteus coralliicola]|uniref:MoxR family ATPase n=1 Tax=Motiliproteus coralliicola TaxID=2283196 RepID=A0A369WW87_9GAMM|nr:MoxR family ATPase [Motiliproteus coralliicola]RDE25299.1 MoxR family ATPase [Motiliproteus coralliicola]
MTELSAQEAREALTRLRGQLADQLLGQARVVDRLLIALLCNGNLLLEGLPGTAKTRSVRALARMMDARLGRIQFTPDLLPADVTGTEVYHHEARGEQLVFEPGPIFNNLVLADEINRAPAKVQSALLEAMEECQVTVAGKSHPLPPLFMVLATQNPLEQEGTYPLPEAQLDRFVMKLRLDYPDEATEREVIRLVRTEELQPLVDLPVIPQDAVFAAREAVSRLEVAPALDDYLVSLVMATRDPERYSGPLADWLEVGVSPRAGIALDRCARAHAWLRGSDFVEPDDVRAVAHDVLRHRLLLTYEAVADGVDADRVIDELLRQVAVV